MKFKDWLSEYYIAMNPADLTYYMGLNPYGYLAYYGYGQRNGIGGDVYPYQLTPQSKVSHEKGNYWAPSQVREFPRFDPNGQNGGTRIWTVRTGMRKVIANQLPEDKLLVIVLVRSDDGWREIARTAIKHEDSKTVKQAVKQWTDGGEQSDIVNILQKYSIDAFYKQKDLQNADI